LPSAIISTADAARELAVVEKRDVLRPGQPDHDAEPVARGFVEQVEARRCVRADRVDAERRHQPEVLGHALLRRKLVAPRIGRERAVRDALHEKPVAADLQKLSVRAGARVRRRSERGPFEFRDGLRRSKT
jgi:hypothetical protein